MKGKPIDIGTRFQRCRHYHVSGRRCGMLIAKGPKAPKECPLHREGSVSCRDCGNMLQAFIPPKGW